MINFTKDTLYVAKEYNLIPNPNSDFSLIFDNGNLTLCKNDEPKLKGIFVDFVAGKALHRRKFGGSEAILQAIGKSNKTVVDATAGLGRDAFVFASAGLKTILLERHPIVAALLEDGLRRAYEDSMIGSWMQDKMILRKNCGLDDLLKENHITDVVYLDPMYPHRTNSALVKKEMRIFQHLVGDDSDAHELLPLACKLVRKRVVVKRPNYAAPLANKSPSMHIAMKNHRFDVYINEKKDI